MTEREAPAKLQDQPDTLAMIEAAFGNTRDILMNGTTMRYLSDHIEELIAARVAVAWQASRQQTIEEAARAVEALGEIQPILDRIKEHAEFNDPEADTKGGQLLMILGELECIRSLTTTGDKA